MDSARSPSQYPFDNAARQAGDRFAGLAALYDAVTRRHLDRLGIGAGWRCLEVGAGGGSVARYMHERVGPNGHVVATDINPQWLPDSLPAGVELWRHDVGGDPLPERTFDLVHARAVLTFVPERRSATARMTAALKPGGWLLIEEMVAPPVSDTAGDPDKDVVRKGRQAIVEVIRRHGGNPAFAWEVPQLMDEAGLTGIGAEGYFVPFRTRAVAILARANLDQIGGEIVRTGLMTAAEVEHYRLLLHRPDYRYPASMALISVWGRRKLRE